MGVGAGLYMCDVVKKVHVRYLISWWVLVLLLFQLFPACCYVAKICRSSCGGPFLWGPCSAEHAEHA